MNDGIGSSSSQKPDPNDTPLPLNDSTQRSRKRAVYLSQESLERLREGLTAKWQVEAPNRRLTNELKAELLGLSSVTAKRVLHGESVDKTTLTTAFQNLSIRFDESDIVAEPPSKLVESSTVGEITAGDDVPSEDAPPSPEPYPEVRSSRPLKSIAWLLPVLSAVLIASIAWSSYRPRAEKPIWRDEFNAIFARGLDHYHHGRLTEAQAEVEKIISGARTHDSAQGFAGALRLAGDVAYGQGRYGEAESFFKESLQTWRRLDHRRNQSELWEAIGNVQLRLGRLGDAETSFAESLRGQKAVGNDVGIAMAHRGLGSVAYRRGDLKAATDGFRTSLRLLKNHVEPDMVVDLRGRLALVHAKEGKTDKGLEELQACLRHWQGKRSLRWIALTEMDIGMLAAETGAHDLATRYLVRSAQGFQRIGDKGNEKAARERIEVIGRIKLSKLDS